MPARTKTSTKKPTVSQGLLDAKSFLAELKANQSDAEREKLQRYFKPDPRAKEKDKFMGIRMGTLFAISKRYTDMPVRELEKLLESDIHEVRAGAVSIMNQAAKIKKTSEVRRKELYDLYMRRHDRINNWDLVDLGAIYAVGGYLADKPRKVLVKLARSKDPWERRTAIIAPMYFILKLKETEDTFRIAEMLIDDQHELVQKAVGWGLRTAGDKDRNRLVRLLDKRAASMPRIILRNAIEKFDAKMKSYYLNLR